MLDLQKVKLYDVKLKNVDIFKSLENLNFQKAVISLKNWYLKKINIYKKLIYSKSGNFNIKGIASLPQTLLF